MFVAEILIAILLAVVMTGLFASLARDPDARLGWPLFLVFMLTFVGVWAGGVWMAPVGPAMWGVYPLSFLAVGAVLFLLLAVAATEPPLRRPIPTEGEVVEEAATAGVLFWSLLVGLGFAVVIYYLAAI